jgi:Domain of unknown function (DUF4129)
MQLDGINIVLRPRAPWEATDLGVALVRQHAGTIFGAWVLVTLPICLLLTKLGMLLGHVWIGVLLLWWLKPVFDRIPLYVLSRAVFGVAPTITETVRAQWAWGRSIWRWLHWRRLHPGRALLLPVDLLEGLSGAQRSERCRVLSRATGSPSLLLTVIGWHVESMLYFSVIALGLMFVRVEFFSESVQAVWATFFESPPVWAQALLNLLYWFAMSVMEPFYVGAGFGLYLNRRTQLEAWDVELAFRRLALRLRNTVSVLALFAVLSMAMLSNARAENSEDEKPIDLKELIESAEAIDLDLDAEPTTEVTDLEEVFSKQYRDDGAAFEASVAKAYKNEDLSPKEMQRRWERRRPEADSKPSDNTMPTWLKSFGQGIAFIAENGLWILLAILLAVLIRYADRWLPWISDGVGRERPLDAIEVHDIALDTPLPDDLPGAVRALWRSGQQRAALALFYRAAVARLVDALGTPLPPGATESDCLRQSRRLQDTQYAGLFARIVRSWQGMAYAERTPSVQDLDALLSAWQSAPEAAAAPEAMP